MLLFDELDALAISRDMTGGDGGDAASSVLARVLSTLLNELDGVEGSNDGVIVLAATNRAAASFDENKSVISLPASLPPAFKFS